MPEALKDEGEMMKRLWIVLALGTALVGCAADSGSKSAVDDGKKQAVDTPEKKDSGEVKTTSDADKGTNPDTASKKPDGAKKSDVIKTTLPDGRIKQATKDGKSVMTTDPKTGATMITSVDKTGHPMTIDRTGNVPISELSVPDYPGGKLMPKDAPVTKITAYGGWEWAIVRLTPDDATKIFAFYKPLLTEAKESGTDPKILTGKSKKGDRITVLVSKTKDEKENRLTVSARRRDPNVKAPAKTATPPPPPPTGAKTVAPPPGRVPVPGQGIPPLRKAPGSPGAG